MGHGHGVSDLGDLGLHEPRPRTSTKWDPRTVVKVECQETALSDLSLVNTSRCTIISHLWER